MSKSINPYAVRKAGKILECATWQDGEEQVRLYGAEWVNFDLAHATVSDERRDQRRTKAINAKADA
ncbi:MULTISPECIES: hypothetical protein [unclassified Mesorhizobium]|uniref:hypothetical protein n=1 Tax=unclassified Mesorhizobium TaxID=325217 RepID=UPI000FCAE4FA|nr:MULTISPECIES: hypothetical protein [unclassified Mesorhizobium]TGU56915.1 hypothetical protein EN791_029725 [Mesorhizobium sp. M2D.F.Ca.ET.148.01.1.1]TGU61296.1 hypothetical protein EN790_29745 [Mesorhizobium sp. M2D.F.Ca.ET.147.01.1.1]